MTDQERAERLSGLLRDALDGWKQSVDEWVKYRHRSFWLMGPWFVVGFVGGAAVVIWAVERGWHP